MKVLQIIAQNDYDAVAFETAFEGHKVSDLIAIMEKGGKLTYVDDDGDEQELYNRIFEVGEVSEKFLNFVRNEVQDYDDTKHSNFYLEYEIVNRK